MDNHRGDRISVPRFGAWDGKTRSEITNYSMAFSEARANRKKHKHQLLNRHSFGNEQELLVMKSQGVDEGSLRHWLIEQQMKITTTEKEKKKNKKMKNCLTTCF
ncbi:hypothetical protein M569_15036 [Genlisea aurea]|uniref:RIN4 pathogenic type III effector avirulence factor Avr cleavage site domain-containing protein n=1 Tax=Genlisea aurea TaxID=192259 RepID=S8BYW4_9LAMI|nr:hypothetical protein M569_15036 [Genlisea aurea]